MAFGEPKLPGDGVHGSRAQRKDETPEEYRADNPQFAAAQEEAWKKKMQEAGMDSENQPPTPEQQQAHQEREEASQMVADYFKGATKIPDGILTPEETQVLSQMETLYTEQKAANPDKPVKFGLDDQSNETYMRLLHRLPLALKEHGHRQNDQAKADEVRGKLGIPKINNFSNEDIEQLSVPAERISAGSQKALFALKKHVDSMLNDGLVKGTKEYWDQQITELKKPENSNRVPGKLLDWSYARLRKGKYPESAEDEQNYKDAYNLVKGNNELSSKEEKGWLYRGTMPSKSKGLETVTRGSFNIKITPESVNALDELIKTGVIEANYKFASMNNGPENSKRHDTVSIYFLKEPSLEALQKMGEIGKKFTRGDNLLGKKIADGFFMSEVGSVSDEQAVNFVKQAQAENPDLGNALNSFLTSTDFDTGAQRIAMSEGQYFAAKEMMEAYGYDIKYDKEKGISIKQL